MSDTSWYQPLVDYLEARNFEMVRAENGSSVFIGPRLPSDEEQVKIVNMLPPEKIVKGIIFHRNIKTKTAHSLMKVMQRHNIRVIDSKIDNDIPRLGLILESYEKVERNVLNQISDLLEKDGYFQVWAIQVNGREVLNHPIFFDELDKVKAPKKDPLSEGMKIAQEERLACERTHPPSLEEIDKLKKLLDECPPDLLVKIL